MYACKFWGSKNGIMQYNFPLYIAYIHITGILPDGKLWIELSLVAILFHSTDAPEFTYPFSPGCTLRLSPDSSLLATQYITLTMLPYYLCFYFCRTIRFFSFFLFLRTIRFLWSTFHVFICRLEFLFCKLSTHTYYHFFL